jgi:hypothetical protein
MREMRKAERRLHWPAKMEFGDGRDVSFGAAKPPEDGERGSGCAAGRTRGATRGFSAGMECPISYFTISLIVGLISPGRRLTATARDAEMK